MQPLLLFLLGIRYFFPFEGPEVDENLPTWRNILIQVLWSVSNGGAGCVRIASRMYSSNDEPRC